MSNYYQYNFISPEPLFAEVKEELKSYFDTGVVDDLLFPVWTKKCLRKLKRGTLPIRDTVLYLDDYSAKLPKDFKYVREAWVCTTTAPVSIRKPGAFYSQTISLLNPSNDRCEPTCGPCRPLVTELIYKTTTDEIYTQKISYLLKPGNANAILHCGNGCPNIGAQSNETFDIRDGHFHTTFREGDVYLTYYAEDRDDLNNILVPENEVIEEYIMAYLKYKIFETLWNNVTDETYNQIETKYRTYAQLKDEAFINAQTETKKRTIYQKVEAMRKSANRLNRYRLR